MKYSIFLLSVLLFVLSLFILTRNINKPFIGIHDWNGARYGQIAKNYLQYGLLATKLGQSEDAAKHLTPGNFYTHYPPLLSLAIAGSYKFFGVSEAATRIVPVIATSSIVVLIFLIGKLLWNTETGIVASLFALATPLVRYFGKNASHEPLVIFFALVAFLGLVLFAFKKQKLGLPLLFLGTIFSEFTGWGGYFIVPAFTVVFWKLGLSKKILVILWLISFSVFFLHLFHVKILTGSFFGGGLRDILFYRLGSGQQEFGFIEFLNQVRLWSSTLLTVTLLVASLLFWAKVIKQKYLTRSDIVMVGLAIFGLSYQFTFSNATFIHNYFVFYFLPFITLAAASGFLWKVGKEWFAPIVAVAVLLLIVFERNSFFQALGTSNNDELAYRAGLEIAFKTQPQDMVLIKPARFGISRAPILAFYGQRDIVFQEEEGVAYNWIVEVDETTNTFHIRRRGLAQ